MYLMERSSRLSRSRTCINIGNRNEHYRRERPVVCLSAWRLDIGRLQFGLGFFRTQSSSPCHSAQRTILASAEKKPELAPLMLYTIQSTQFIQDPSIESSQSSKPPPSTSRLCPSSYQRPSLQDSESAREEMLETVQSSLADSVYVLKEADLSQDVADALADVDVESPFWILLTVRGL